MPLSFLAALGTDTEEIEPMIHDLKARLNGEFLRQISQTCQIRIHDLFTFHTDQVGMGKGLVSIIPVAAFRESQLQNFIQILEQSDFIVCWQRPVWQYWNNAMAVIRTESGVYLTDAQMCLSLELK